MDKQVQRHFQMTSFTSYITTIIPDSTFKRPLLKASPKVNNIVTTVTQWKYCHAANSYLADHWCMCHQKSCLDTTGNIYPPGENPCTVNLSEKNWRLLLIISQDWNHLFKLGLGYKHEVHLLLHAQIQARSSEFKEPSIPWVITIIVTENTESNKHGQINFDAYYIAIIV